MNRGCWVAAVTPMKTDASIDYEGWSKLLERFESSEITGVVVLGTTGESATIELSERAKLLSIANEILITKPWMVGVGHASLKQALVYTNQAQEFSPTALMVVTPYYNRPMSKGIALYFQALLSETNLPTIAYNVPTRTGIDVFTEVWDELYGHKYFAGIKEAHFDIDRASILKQRYPDLMIYSGNDSNLVNWLEKGGDGIISVIANLVPNHYSNICNLCFDGLYEKAHALMQELRNELNAMDRAVNPIAIKCLMHAEGIIDLGVRLPLHIDSELFYNVIRGEKC